MGLLYSFISPDNGISSFTGENKNLACPGLSIAAVVVVVVVVVVVAVVFVIVVLAVVVVVVAAVVVITGFEWQLQS